jgi:hypothetical protein
MDQRVVLIMHFVLIFSDMSSAAPPTTRIMDATDAAGTATTVTANPDGAAAAEEFTPVEHRRPRQLAAQRSVRYTREPYLPASENGGGELGSDMTEITNVLMTGDTETERGSRYVKICCYSFFYGSFCAFFLSVQSLYNDVFIFRK